MKCRHFEISHQKTNLIRHWNFSQHGNNKFVLVVLGSKPLHSYSSFSSIFTQPWTRSLGYFNPYRNLTPNIGCNGSAVWGDQTISIILQLFIALCFCSGSQVWPAVLCRRNGVSSLSCSSSTPLPVAALRELYKLKEGELGSRPEGSAGGAFPIQQISTQN